jgi:hypothetical protein
MQYVELVNRTKRTLRGTWNGKVYQLKPGSHHLPELVAEAIKRQNLIMGTEDPYTLWADYYVGIREQGDDCEPLEEDPGATKAIERFNRAKLVGAKPTEVVKGNTGVYGRASIETTMSKESSFVDPTH